MAGGDNQDLTSEECVRAGMYWFGRSDFTAADAWWQRALEIDPSNTRAQECLRLLSKSSSTGLESGDLPHGTDDLNRISTDAGLSSEDLDFESEPSSENMAILTAGEDGEPSVPMDAVDEPAIMLAPSGDLRSSPIEGPQSSRDLPPVSDKPHGTEFPFYDDPDPEPVAPTDPFDFAVTGQQQARPPSSSRTPAPQMSPWDEGPSKTSVVTLDDSGGYDAVPDPTPLPAIDRKRFFGREDPETQKEIIDYLRATGDLPATPATPEDTFYDPKSPSDDPGILIDDPVEFQASEQRPAPPRRSTSSLAGDPAAMLEEGRRRYQLHDFQGAIEVLEAIPAEASETGEARNLTASSRRQMLKMYESKIGDFEQIPQVLISSEEIIWLNLNHRAGFILSQIDGSVTYEDIISLSGMPRLDTVQILSELLNDRVIGVR